MPRMHLSVRALALAVVALVLSAGAAAPSARAAARVVKLDADRYLNDYTLVTIDPGTALKQVRERGAVNISAGLESFDVELAPHDLRAPNYRAEETLEDGSVRELPAQPVTTYAGRVANHEGATARFTMDDGHLSGMILDGEDRVFVEPLATFSLAGGPTDYVVYHERDVRADAEPGTCGVTGAEKFSSALDGTSEEVQNAQKTATSTIELATETDNEYVNALGSAQAANSDILTIVNQIDGVYQAELGLGILVTLQNTYAGADPYTSTTDPSTMLSEFRTYWNANRTGVQRDVAHMWTGRDMTGSTIGIAYVGVVCASPTYSYGVSQRWTGTPQRYILSAHEIGHNLNACHSDTSCNPNPGSCTNTIMQSSVGTGFTFCQFSRDQINTWVAGHSSCLTSGGTPTPPAAPSSAAASAPTATQVNLTWRDNSSNESGFKIERKTGAGGTYAQIATTGAGATSYTNSAMTGGTTYVYRVRATNSAGDSAYSNEATVTTPTATLPAAPTALTATAVSRTQVNLAWADNASNENGFSVERSADGVTFAQVGTVPANVTTYVSTGLRRNRSYWFRVRAYNGSGNSGYSNTATARTPRRGQR